MIGSLNNIGLSGIQSGLSNLQKNSAQIASVSTMETTDAQSLLTAVVDLKANVMQVSASMAVLNVSDELVGTILDIKT